MLSYRVMMNMACLVMVLCIVMLQSSLTLAQRRLVDRVVAVIDDQIITEREIDKKATQQGMTLQKALEEQIDEYLLEQEVTRNQERLAVSDKDIDRSIEEVMRVNHLTYETLQAALYGQGMTWVEYRQTLRKQIERARLLQFKMQGRVVVQDAQAKRYCLERNRRATAQEPAYEQVCAEHLLLAKPPQVDSKTWQKLRIKAQKVSDELHAGADFTALMEHLPEPKKFWSSASLGCFSRGEMVENFERVAFALLEGEISQVVETEFGFHIIKIVERRVLEKTVDCDSPEALNAYRNEIYQEEMQRNMRLWLQELRDKAFVEVRL